MERKTICIDLGHCESSGAFPRQTDTSRYEIQRLTLVGENKVIPTQLILLDEQMQRLKGHNMPDYDLLQTLGEIRIGPDLSAYVPDGEKFNYFKVAPKDFDKPYGDGDCARRCGITHGILMACFAFALVDSILKLHTSDIGAERDNLELLIGCPSTEDWTTQEAQTAYAHLIQTATKVHSVRIIPESRAAMFSSVGNKQENISALDGALVFDFGSSTADCTYMLLGRKMIEFSWALGASEIERQIVRDAFEEAQVNGPFGAMVASIIDSEDQVRAAKESYYNGGYGPMGYPMFCCFQNAKDGSRMDVKISIDKQYMEKVTEEKIIEILCDSRTTISGSWKELCKAFFREAATRIATATYCLEENGVERRIPCKVKTVILTGGASRMDFVYECCLEVFPDIHIVREANPSHTVSSGLAWVAVSDKNFGICRDAALLEINSKTDCSIQALRNNISNALFERLTEIVRQYTQDWANQPEETLSLRQLQDKLTAHMSTFECQSEMESICRQEIGQWKDILSATMETAINNQVTRLYSEQVAKGLMIPNDVWQELRAGALSINQIDLSGTLGDLDMASWMRKLGSIVGGMLVVVAATLLMILSEGLLAPLLVAGGGGGLVGANMTDKDLDKPRKKNSRIEAARKISTRMKKNKAKIMEEFNKSLEQQTANYAEIVCKTLTDALEIITLKRFKV